MSHHARLLTQGSIPLREVNFNPRDLRNSKLQQCINGVVENVHL